MALFVFFPTSTWARVIPSDLRGVWIPQHATVKKISDHFRTTGDREYQRRRAGHLRVSAEVHAAVNFKSPKSEFRIFRPLRALVFECAFAEISRDVSFPARKHLRKKSVALVIEN